ncbi:MAG: hypothetical protein HC866_19885 [Leptolyngbyaceae cyanobacterium RU_5_1]|nr:hypothetical protein [Leptolyngbyaceae cyanobacterium RU_5_1]
MRIEREAQLRALQSHPMVVAAFVYRSIGIVVIVRRGIVSHGFGLLTQSLTACH